MSVEKQVIIIFAATKKLLLDIPTNKINEFEEELLRFVENKYPEVLEEIRTKKEISDELAGKLVEIVEQCKKA